MDQIVSLWYVFIEALSYLNAFTVLQYTILQNWLPSTSSTYPSYSFKNCVYYTKAKNGHLLFEENNLALFLLLHLKSSPEVLAYSRLSSNPIHDYQFLKYAIKPLLDYSQYDSSTYEESSLAIPSWKTIPLSVDISFLHLNKNSSPDILKMPSQNLAHNTLTT